MALEWHRAMSHLPEECVVAAVERYIGSPATRFPVPGQLIELAKDDVDWLRRASYLQGRDVKMPTPEPYDGEPPQRTPEEVARIKRMADTWRDQFGDAKKQSLNARMDEWAPASQDGASDVLKNCKLVRGELDTAIKTEAEA